MRKPHFHAYCTKCKARTPHESYYLIGMGWGCFMTVITFGMFIPLWLFYAHMEDSWPSRCQICGEPDMDVPAGKLPPWKPKREWKATDQKQPRTRKRRSE
jgi:hypothetical protein